MSFYTDRDEPSGWFKLGVIVALIFFAFILDNVMSGIQCKTKTLGLEYPSRYIVFGGCQVQDEGRWIPLDNWRYFGEEK